MEMNEDQRNYVNLLNDAINRMASNSANAKSYLVAIVAAFIAIQMPNKGNAYIVLLSLVPTILFYWMDCYYLSLENRFRNLQEQFLKETKGEVATTIAPVYGFNIYDIKDKHPKREVILSWATTPFYLVVAGCITGLWAIIKFM